MYNVYPNPRKHEVTHKPGIENWSPSPKTNAPSIKLLPKVTSCWFLLTVTAE